MEIAPALHPSHREARQRFLTRGFLPVQTEEIGLYRRWINGWTLLTELSAANLIAWGIAAYRALYKVIAGYFCSVWFPCGGGPIEIQIHPSAEAPRIPLRGLIDALWETVSGTGDALAIYTIEERLLKDYTDVQGYAVRTDWTDDRSEYIYRIADLLELSGKENAEKRRHLRKCAACDRVSLAPVGKANVQMCVDIQNQWCGQQDCGACAALCGCEKNALENMTAIFDGNVYEGAYLYMEEKPAGFAIWERLDEERVFLYFAKALVSDFNTYLYYKIAETYFADAESLSMGSDMGKPGLRFFKRHLGRHTLARKYRCAYSKGGSL
ncbi:MAG: DUF2156 domain-containing protein [Treponema sp.]|jgi:hypothetical protein|nr:DUF2156 domain-containing protein [Treponema sp.]